MADRFWVGGSGNWSDTARWSASTGGSSGASVPTAADDVYFDANSNVGTGAFTVTVDGTSTSPSICNSFSTGGAGGALDGAMTLAFGSTGYLDVYGSLTLPATNLSVTGASGSEIRFQSTTSGNTITTNGVSLAQVTVFRCAGAGGEWTLGSALTAGALFVAGTFSTANYSMTLNSIQRTSSVVSASVINLGSSSISLSGSSPVNFTNITDFTFDAGTSTITCSTSGPTFTGGGFTFYNVTFSNGGSATTTINGANTFNDLTQASRSATGRRLVTLNANQVVNGTLTLGASNTAIRRIFVFSDTVGVQRTITLNGTLATLNDVDFRDIATAGTVTPPWTGTRLGDCLGNSGITFDAPKTVYWNLAGTQNWSATGWATTSTGVPAANNFPLAQDTATFTEAGAAGTVTFDSGWNIGAIQMADGVSNRTTAFTLSITASIFCYKSITLFSNLTLSGTSAITFAGQGTTQTVTSAGDTWTQSIIVNVPNGIFKIADAFAQTATAGFVHTAGTVDLNNLTLTCYLWSSSNSNLRSILFGTTGQIVITGNNATVWTTSTVTNWSYTGTSNVVFNYSGATGTRSILVGAAGEALALNVSVTAGTDTVSLGTTSGAYKNLDFTGFAGTITQSNSILVYGNLTIPATATYASASGTQALSFRATSGTQQITTNGVTIDRRIIVNAPGATVALQDAITQGSTREFSFQAGILKFKDGVTSTVGSFTTSGTTMKYLESTTAGVQATLSQASGTVSVSYTVIRDINATGGATWDAPLSAFNIDAGNNTGWNFYPPFLAEADGTQLRSFTERRRF